tara:strand:+ start:93 stop:881 length:789 start_codon:yes stop_codon:yes gene_type:complete
MDDINSLEEEYDNIIIKEKYVTKMEDRVWSKLFSLERQFKIKLGQKRESFVVSDSESEDDLAEPLSPDDPIMVELKKKINHIKKKQMQIEWDGYRLRKRNKEIRKKLINYKDLWVFEKESSNFSKKSIQYKFVLLNNKKILFLGDDMNRDYIGTYEKTKNYLRLYIKHRPDLCCTPPNFSGLFHMKKKQEKWIMKRKKSSGPKNGPLRCNRICYKDTNVLLKQKNDRIAKLEKELAHALQAARRPPLVSDIAQKVEPPLMID